MRCYYIRILKFKNPDHAKLWQRYGATRTPICRWGECTVGPSPHKTAGKSFNRWLNAQSVVHQMRKCYSVLNRKALSSQEETWRKPKHTLLRERSQSEESTPCTILPDDILEKAELCVDGARSWSSRKSMGFLILGSWVWVPHWVWRLFKWIQIFKN